MNMLFSSEYALKMGVIGQNLLYAGTIYFADSNRFKLVAKPYCVRKLFRSANSNRFKQVAKPYCVRNFFALQTVILFLWICNRFHPQSLPSGKLYNADESGFTAG